MNQHFKQGRLPIHSRYFLLATLLLIYPMLGWADPPKGYNFISYDQGLRVAQKENKKVFLYMGRYGCGFCDKTNKESFINKKVYNKYSKHYVLVYVDSESSRRLTLPSGERITEQQLAARLKTLVTPYFLFLEADGSLIMKLPGFKTDTDLLLFDMYVFGNHYKTKTFSQFSKQLNKKDL